MQIGTAIYYKHCFKMVEPLILNAFKETLKDGVTGGKIALADGSKSLVVSSTWKQRNIERNCSMLNKYVQMVNLETNEVTSLHAAENSTELLTSYSPSFKYRCVLRSVTESGTNTKKKQHLEIWENNWMKVNLDLTAHDKHGDVYTDG
ncbi:N-acylaminoacyl-peptide hydrolase [Nesidiocoris tenuis]|uniref:N-acylaminoacyl-peptide hydrolase n=1 Tax=Nesidiocoris tenuis TaxID=355587 RepID=A0ABN7AZE4_9HEMI|nr:N-acylaminoacyl-peptide hydrolase [Nesidiocoris tenuis]